jgi:oxygen-independent coproporphyrinogen-3 oxidase
MMQDLSVRETECLQALYVHIPFCAKHCAYCDFNVHVVQAQSELVPQTVDAICLDIERTSIEEGVQAFRRSGVQKNATPLMDTPTLEYPIPDTQYPTSERLTTIFFGGGTPTFLSGAQLGQILRTIRECFSVDREAEISSEANPGSSDAAKFAAMREAGINRLSIGVQSFDDGLLTALDRFHTAGEAERAVQAAREAGFTNLSLDLMFGLPRQNAEQWGATLQRALDCQTEHLSLYALTLEPGTRFERLRAGGKLDLPDEDTELAMYEQAIATLRAAGYEHYEVSNFARPGFRCRHNQVYWRNEPYLGIGPGAVSYLQGRRWKRERLPARYIEKVHAGADLSVESETLEREGTLGETMMLGLRLLDGLPLQRIRDRFRIEPLTHFAMQIARLRTEGLLALENDHLRLTHRGLLLANTVLSEFLPD